MDDIEKLKAENSDLQAKVDELRKAAETNERLLRIVENLSKGH